MRDGIGFRPKREPVFVLWQEGAPKKGSDHSTSLFLMA
jgi:hypothetical protein